MPISIELFPPRNSEGAARLDTLLAGLSRYQISKLSVTEGALASDAAGSMETIERAQALTGLPITSHLVSWGKSEQEIVWQVEKLRTLKVRSILALRGDKRGTEPGVFAQADQLTAYLNKVAPEFEIGIAAYPEGHPEDRDFRQTLDILASKADAGARFAVTQFCFDLDALERLRQGLADRNIAIDLHVGVLPIRELASAKRLAQQCGADIPDWIATWIAAWEEETGQTWNDQGAAALALDWCQQLKTRGFDHLHLYALNRAQPTLDLLQGLDLGKRRIATADRRPSRADFATATTL